MTDPTRTPGPDPATVTEQPHTAEAETGLPPDNLVAPEAADDEWEDDDSPAEGGAAEGRPARKRRRRRAVAAEAAEMRMQGRRALCKTVADIAPHMLKTVKL